jgi:hypothetical protein
MHKMKRISPRYTICQVLRDIYHASTDKDIRLKLRVAVSMAKSMDKKLRKYKPHYDIDLYDTNKNLGRGGKDDVRGP